MNICITAVLSLLSLAVVVNGNPHFSWDTLSLYAHCGNSSGEISDETIRFFSSLSFVTLEKWHALESVPQYHGMR
jgi:hypothetical protein